MAYLIDGIACHVINLTNESTDGTMPKCMAEEIFLADRAERIRCDQKGGVEDLDE